MKQADLASEIPKLLEQIHTEMYDKALKQRLDHVKEVDNWKDFMDALGGRNLCSAPWCDVQDCEVQVKDRSKEESLQLMLEKNEEEAMLTGSAKTLCIPFEQKPLAEGTKCFACGKDAKCTALWGRSY
jgi:prolyl-tRNA synthetase